MQSVERAHNRHIIVKAAFVITLRQGETFENVKQMMTISDSPNYYSTKLTAI